MTREDEGSALGLFSAELKHARTARGLTQEALGDKIAYSSSLVAMVETGRRVPTLDLAGRCDEALDTSGVLARMHRLVAAEAYPSWFRPFVELEKAATSLRWWEPLLIPGLFQTGEYARAVLRAARPHDRDEAIDQLVTARLDRQAILMRDDPPNVWVVIDEGVLSRPVGEPGVMAAQLDRVIAAARDPWVTVQVMPTAAGAHPGLLGPFVIAGFASAPMWPILTMRSPARSLSAARTSLTWRPSRHHPGRGASTPGVRRPDHPCSEDQMDVTTTTPAAVWRIIRKRRRMR